MQLPIVSPMIKHCPTDAYLLSILQCHPQTNPWIFNNFLWETITVDFGGIGHITNSKENMETNGAGWYFPAGDFKLE